MAGQKGKRERGECLKYRTIAAVDRSHTHTHVLFNAYEDACQSCPLASKRKETIKCILNYRMCFVNLNRMLVALCNSIKLHESIYILFFFTLFYNPLTCFKYS